MKITQNTQNRGIERNGYGIVFGNGKKTNAFMNIFQTKEGAEEMAKNNPMKKTLKNMRVVRAKVFYLLDD